MSRQPRRSIGIGAEMISVSVRPTAAKEEGPSATPPEVTAAPAPGTRHPTLVVAVLLSIAAIWLARPILVPMVMGMLISYALYPLQRRLVGWGTPRALAASLILIVVLGGCAAGGYALADQASAFLADGPRVARRLRTAIESARQSGPSTLEQVQTAANELKEAATPPTSAPPPPGVARVQIETPSVQVQDLLWQGGLGALELAGQLLLVVFLAYYLLASGDLYKRKIVKNVPSLSRKKITVEILNDIDRQIEGFLVTRSMVSGIVGVATALSFWALGLGQPAIWGCAAGLLNIFPYLGPTAVTVAAGVAAYLQFGTIAMGAAVAGAAMAVASIEGFVVTPWLMGRAGRMSPAAILVGVSLWGWLWGLSGMFLAVPILMVAKAVCDHVDGLQFIGDLLAD